MEEFKGNSTSSEKLYADLLEFQAKQGGKGRGKKWTVRVTEKSKTQSKRESKRGKKGLSKKGVDVGKQEKKKQEKGEGGALVCFQVIKTNQYGKRQNRYNTMTPNSHFCSFFRRYVWLFILFLPSAEFSHFRPLVLQT